MENTTEIENILKHYLEPTIKQLTFGYEIKPSDLYYLVGRCKFPSETLDVNTIDSIADRVKRIMKIVMLDDEDIKLTNPDPYGKPKKYDDTDMTDPDDYFFIQSEILQEHTFLLRCIIIADLLIKGIELGKNKKDETIFASSELSFKLGLSDDDLQNITISDIELTVSIRLAEIIKTYVDNSIMMAKEMMLSLSEACVVTTNTVQEFFEII